MPLDHLQHFLIQTADMEATRDFYTRVLGMRVGPSPDFKLPVIWLYIGDKDVLHIAEGGAPVGPFTGAQLAQAIAVGRVGRDTLVWSPGMSEWMVASQVPNLRGAFASQPPPVPPSS